MAAIHQLIVRNASLKGQSVDLYITGNRISRIVPHPSASVSSPDSPDAVCVDAQGMSVFPAFYNTHNHAAMTLLRGYADDLLLMEWLEKHIWPAEARFTDEHIRVGVRLACLEMIKSGTVLFNDMYWKEEVALPVVEAMGLRAALGVLLIDTQDSREQERNFGLLEQFVPKPDGRVSLAVAPHSVYTVSGELLRKSAEAARRNGQKIHIHLCETQGEVESCLKQHGCTPVAYLDRMGFLGDDVIAAHVVHVTDEDIRLLAERGVTVAHCPVSNMKLSSGIAPVQKMLEAGCRVTLATDGCSSNNNLDMREEMKIAALLAKVSSGPQALPAGEVLRMATRAGAETFGWDAGAVEEGRLADLILVRNDRACMTPMFHPESNWVYAADSSLIDTVICDGRMLMQGRKVEGEEEILADARRIAATLR
ncbi:amidohydrolase [uncultured Bacteroides sp.]|uniref:amidohydrolase n=1 Tax=uncultured Bacteroides sp. TaxID=162156 RepID=UPI0026080521|nr:amidohydrolase [uncultured Bacteroides sp.]